MAFHDIRIACTDRRQHPSRELNGLVLYDLGDLIHRRIVESSGRPPEEIEWALAYDRISFRWQRDSRRGDNVQLGPPEQILGDVGDPEYIGQVWRFRQCPTCRRDARIGNRKLLKVLDGLVELAGDTQVVSLDVSALPAIFE